jgi:SAM-dependent methyltransferase
MKCLVCHNKQFHTIFSYDKPDKYEKWVGIENINRSWVQCVNCGFYMQIRDYDLEILEGIYRNGYRDKKFRGESISKAFDRIMAIKDNENQARFIWFAMNKSYEDSKCVLDIGSGIGVWPAILKTAGYDVNCVEENELSIEFIQDRLGFFCYSDIDCVDKQYDTVSLIHVLEHISKPDDFLKVVKQKIKPSGSVFIEVPDSIEFSYLNKNHDEFNSCHVCFYDMSSLYRLLTRNGFTVVDMHEEKTMRSLSRIMAIAIN